jgi:hypothetical protein
MLHHIDGESARVPQQPFIDDDPGRTPTVDKESKERQKWRTTLYLFVALTCAVFFH